MAFESKEHAKQYWKKNLRLMGSLLVVWFVVSYGFGILLVDVLNNFSLGGFKLGFWFAQQGSIYTFLVLIIIYIIGMNRIDREFNVQDD